MLGRLRTAVENTRRFGPGYALLVPARRAAIKAARRMDDRLLEAEQRRGVLGPAHRAWTGNEAQANREHWEAWDWSGGGGGAHGRLPARAPPRRWHGPGDRPGRRALDRGPAPTCRAADPRRSRADA